MFQYINICSRTELSIQNIAQCRDLVRKYNQMDSSFCISTRGSNHRKGGKGNFNMGKVLVEESTITDNKSKTEGQTLFFLPKYHSPLSLISNIAQRNH